MPLHLLAAWPSIFVAVVMLLMESLRRRRGARLPPGPIPLPIVGNALQVPRTHLGREFSEMSSKYGDIVYLNALGQPMVLLGSFKAACDLLDKRSVNYSDRPTSVMVQLVGFDWLFILMNYGTEWRRQRRIFHQMMNSDVVDQYKPIQLNAARNFLRNVLHSPKDLALQIEFTFAATVMRVAYGIKISEPNDKYFKMVRRMSEVGEEIVVPGRFVVEAIPSLRFLPSWFPGGGFKRYAAEAKRDILYTVEYLFNTAKAAMDEGVVKDSVVTRILEGVHSEDATAADIEELCKGVAATTYVAGADTVNSAMTGFFLAMALYPEAQRKAQAELDAVVGLDRLPDFSDRSSLPYTSALLKELLRWHIVTPIGVPHRTVVDDEYKGYLIPAGTTIFANVWGISRDTEVYPNPESFVPERFLDKNGHLDLEGKDPADFVFGFGRRICPGQHFAEASLFILCASILWSFNIGPPVDNQGVPIKLERKITTNAAVSRADVPQYTIKPRSTYAEELILGMT